MKKGDIFVLHCNSCVKDTKHQVACHHWWSKSDQNSHGDCFDYEYKTAILICDDCNTPQLCTEERCELLTDDFSIKYFPPHPVRKLPLWTSELPVNISNLLKETHVALANGLLWLVAMGGRTLIDMFALEKVGDIGGFEKKLEKLESEKYLSDADRKIIKEALEVGHEATHRNKCPSFQDCQSALDIIEHLLQRLVVEVSADRIRCNRSNGITTQE